MYLVKEGTSCNVSSSPPCREEGLKARRVISQGCRRGHGFEPPIKGSQKASSCEQRKMSDFVKRKWKEYLLKPSPKAFAVNRECIGCYFFYGSRSPRKAAEDALQKCSKELGECDIYAVNHERYAGEPMAVAISNSEPNG